MAGDDTAEKSTMEKGSSSSSSIDQTSVYYLHPSDYIRQMHVNDALSDGNYSDWAQEMTNFLFSKNKYGFVDGTIPLPEDDPKEIMAWKRCDAMIKGWLTTAMEKDIRDSVKYANTAEEIWKDLEERFGKESAPRAYELKQTVSTMRQDGVSISTYYTKLKSIWDEMSSVSPTPRCTCAGCSCGVGKKLVEAKEKERLYEFLMGLDKEFGTIKTQILAMRPTPTLGAAYHMVAEDERQRMISGFKKPVTEAAAFQAQSFRQPNRDTLTTRNPQSIRFVLHLKYLYGVQRVQVRKGLQINQNILD